MVAVSERGLTVGLSSNVLETGGGFGHPDGIGTYTRELERELIAAGVSVRRIGAPVRVGARLIAPKEASLKFSLPLPWLAAGATALRTTIPGVAAIEREIDLYHATDYMVPRLPRTPLVATIHDAIPIAHPEWANPRLRRIKNWLLRSCASCADLVIAVSEAAVPELVEHYRIPPARIRVVPLGVDARWFVRPDDALIRQTLASRALAPGYFLHVGTLQPRKNLDALVSAYEQLPPTVRSQRQLVLVGKYGWGAHALQARLEALRARGRIVWLDYVGRDELQALYWSAGVFVFPSLAEGFGLPLLEALAVGLPAIASDLPVLREVAQYHAEFVSPRRVDALADAMARAHEASDDMIASAARREHAQRFDWKTVAARTIEVYRELTTGR